MTTKGIIISFCIALFINAIIAGPFIYLAYCNPRMECVTIHEKTVLIRQVEGKHSQDYLIYTDKGAFEISDQLLYGKFNSSDIYARLKINSKVQIKVCGKRVPFLSMYPNIIEVIP